MATIDDKVISISLEASKFEAGVNQVLRSIEKLKKSLDAKSMGKGLDQIGDSAKKIDLSRIGQGVEGIKGKLSALSVAATAIFAGIALKAAAAGAQLVKAFTIEPMKAGFQEYSTNLNAVQTILANTQAAGTKLGDVNKALAELNTYSDKTIYNFSEMARNIGTFTAAGVDLKTSVASIKGIANVAALSGSNSEQASTAMYQLSQAIAAGSVKLQDWNSVVNAGMGGTVFQRALAETAVKVGTLKEGMVKLKGPMKNVTIQGEAFRNSLSTPGKASWLTSKVLTQTLKHFTGDLTDAQLKAEGFNAAQIKAIQATAKTAQEAATKVKTLQQVLDVAKETAGSGWAKTWQIVFGNFSQARVTFTNLSNAINGFINKNAEARNKVLASWKALGGRTILIDSIKTAFKNLGEILKPIKQAFHDIFPPATGKSLLELTKRFQDFAKALKPSEQTVANLRRTFRGVFAIFDIGKQAIQGIITMFRYLFESMGNGNGQLLNFTGNIGDAIVRFDKWLKSGNRLQNFMGKLGDSLGKLLKPLAKIRDAIGELIGGKGSGGFSKWIQGITKDMHPFQKMADLASAGWDKFMSLMGKLSAKIKPEIDKVIQSIKNLGPALANAVKDMNFQNVLSVLKTGLFAGLVLMFKKFLGKGSFIDQLGKGLNKATGGILENVNGMVANISGSFKALTGSLEAMQQNLKAKTLKEIGIAIALLAASVVALSFVDPKKLDSALSAIAIGFGELLGAMKVLTLITKTQGFIKLPLITAGLILLAGAIDTLSFAVIALSFLSWDQLIKGLTGVGALLGGLAIAVRPLSQASKGMFVSGAGLMLIAAALNFLVIPVKVFGAMKWKDLGKGLAGVGGGLAILAAGMRAMPSKGMFVAGAGLILVGVGLHLMIGPIQSMSKMQWGKMGKGLVGIGGGLATIAAGMKVMPKNMPILAAGLIALSYALGKITDIIVKLSGMKWSQLGKGLAGLGGALAILAGGMELMSEGLPGAAALIIAAGAIWILSTALTKMGGQSWGSIVKGLFELAAALAIIGGAAVLLTPAIPSMLALGAALIVIGAGLTLVGAGVFLIGTGLSALAVGIAALVSTIIDGIVKIVEAIPKIVTGLIQLIHAIADAAPAILDALIQMVESFVKVFMELAPVVGKAMLQIIEYILSALWNNRGRIAQAGLDLIMALIHGILGASGNLISTMLSLIGKVLVAIASAIGKMVAFGANWVMGLVRGILSRIGQVVSAAANAVARFVTGIAQGVAKLVTGGANWIAGLVRGILSRLGQVASAAVSAISRFVSSILGGGGRVASSGTSTMGRFVTAMATAAVRLVATGVAAVGHFLSGVLSAIGGAAAAAGSAAVSIGTAMAQGVISGITSMAGSVASAAKSMVSGAISGAKSMLHINSPSLVFMEFGSSVGEGFAKGIGDNSKQVYSIAAGMAGNAIYAVKDTLQISSPSKVMIALGKEVARGFAVGIRSDADHIKQAFIDMNQKIADGMVQTRQIIASEEEKLKKLREAKKPDAKAIKEAQAVIAENEAILKRQQSAHELLVKGLKAQKIELIGLANQYEKIGEKLKAAQQALADAKKTREEAIKGFADQYSALPDIVTKDAEGNAVDQLATYEDALKHQADAVAAYQSTLDQLRKLGLDDATYQKLLAEGTADQAFADQLLAGGKTAVDGLNKLDKQLKANSAVLAKHAGHNLYDAGVAAAQGVVNGLKSKESHIAKEMEQIARIMVAALKKELGIKSPSKVFAEIGRYSMEGFTKGFSEASGAISDAVDGAARGALDTMKKSMRDISAVVAEHLDVNPTITPILDLTQVKAQAGELASITNVAPITAAASYGQASTIASQQTATGVEETNVAPGGTHVKFEQNNYSPEALSEIQIYRQTRNQLSQLKSALAIS